MDKEDLIILLQMSIVILVAIVAVGAIVAAIIIPIAKYNCTKLGEQVGYETEYNFFGSGCLLDIDGEKIPKNRWINNTGN